MIDFDQIEIGSVYLPVKDLRTTDLSHELPIHSCFTILSKDLMSFVTKKKYYRFKIIYNGLHQVLMIPATTENKVPFKKLV